MVIKNGTKVVVNGQESTVESSFASGKHVQSVLSDGRTILDLEKLIASGEAQEIQDVPKPPMKFGRNSDKE